MSSRTFNYHATVGTGGSTGGFKGLYIGTGGHVHITDGDGASTIFRSVPTGTFMDVAGTRVGSTLEATAPAAEAIVKLD
jgi:hypothetical protein